MESTSETTEALETGVSDSSSESTNNIFNADTIFTSGSFNVNSDVDSISDSIFTGEIELAQLKITKEKDETWSPEFWQASGTLGIDLNGLDISGTVDAAYYKQAQKSLDLFSPSRGSASPISPIHSPKQILMQ